MKAKEVQFYPKTKRELDIMLKIKSKAKFEPDDRYEWSKLMALVLSDGLFDGRKFCRSFVVQEDSNGKIFCTMKQVNTAGIPKEG